MVRSRTFLVLAMAAALVLTASMGGAQQEPYPYGTLSIEATQVAAGVGFTWGEGVMTFQGKTVPFKVRGINVVAVGISKINASGEVYNLKNISDFPGNYVVAQAGAAIIKGPAGLVMKNDKGVVINLKATQEGVQFNLGPDGMKISLK